MSPTPPEDPTPPALTRRALREAAARAEAVAEAAGAGSDTPAPAEPAAEPAPEPAAPANAAPETTPRTASNRSLRRAQLGAEPPREKRSRKGAWGCLIALVVILALLAGGAFALQEPIRLLLAAVQGPADYSDSDATKGVTSEDSIVMIHEGDTGDDVAKTLFEQDVIKSAQAFYDVIVSQSPEPVFQPGAYQLSTKLSAEAALLALEDPANRLDQTVVVPEGTAAVDVFQLISEGTSLPLAEIETAAKDVAAFGLPAEATTLEGFLFPATYTFLPGTTAPDALRKMIDRQFDALDSAGVPPADRWKTIVFASLIQREAGLPDDYYKVARVFVNRLDPKKWKSGTLESDATVAYGTGNTHLVTTTDAERANAKNRYNTYLHPGMVIGPISNPGDLAIDAALHPAEGTWLFFVTVNLDTGETVFSNTVEQHNAAVKVWQDWMRANRG